MAFHLLLLVLTTLSAQAQDITTNSATVHSAPKWVKAFQVQKTIDRIQRFLEWDIRRIQVYWYTDPSAFQKAHGYDSSVLAVSKSADNSIHIGPKVNAENFEGTFGHELVHIILFQKYKTAIPKWLEEGLANYVAKRGVVDYKELAQYPQLKAKSLEHPFKNQVQIPTRVHYMASTAMMEMIASKCNVHSLLQLSVGEKLEGYLGTLCGIENLDSAFQAWIQKKKGFVRGTK